MKRSPENGSKSRPRPAATWASASILRANCMLSLVRPEIGFRLAAPMDGAFYAFCDVSGLTNDSMQFARKMLAEAHVAATPGRDFDPFSGERFMRFSYAGSHEEMIAATDRIGGWLGR